MTPRASVGRVVLVIEERPYLWAALRQRIAPATAYVRSAAPDEVAAVWERCRPWPWVVAATTRALPSSLPGLLGSRPIPVHWLGEAPAGLPRAPERHEDWLELVAALERLGELLTCGVGGVRLLRNRGLVAPDGRMVLDAPHLEGLLAAPGGLPPPLDVQAVRAELAGNRLPLALDEARGHVRLAARSAAPA